MASLHKGNFVSNLVKFHIFVPESCFPHKLEFIQKEGKEFVEIHQIGSDFEKCVKEARKYA